MTLAEATSRFIDDASQNEVTVMGRLQPNSVNRALSFLWSCFPPDASLCEITPSKLRDVLSRCYVEKASGSKARNSKVLEHHSPSTANGAHEDLDAKPTDQVPETLDLLDSLDEFFQWTDQQAGADQATQISPILIELRRSLPRALAITEALTSSLQERGGPFHFPEFLTSFEEGGSSQYDIDAPGNVGAIDGYFRILRVQGSWVEAEELISEERVWPIVFPLGVAELLDYGYIISLELVREAEGWQIVGCGSAYPPDTETG